MVMLQPKLHLKVSQRQILTPGLVQMVSVLALNKLEYGNMIRMEMVENPVLEELEDAVPLLDDVGRKEEDRDAPRPQRKNRRRPQKKRKTRLKKSISDRSSRNISIPGTAASASRKTSSGLHSKISCRNQVC